MDEVLKCLQNADTQSPEIEEYIKRASWILSNESKNEDSYEQFNQISHTQDSNIQIANDIKSELEEYMLIEASKDALFKNLELETDESNEKISQSMMIDILATCVAKIVCELQDIATAVNDGYTKRYNAICKELIMDSEQIEYIEKPEITELISKGIDSLKIGKYLISVLGNCIAVEIKKCSLVIKNEPNNVEGEEKKIPLSKLGYLMVIMLTKYCSEHIVAILEMKENLKNKYDALYENLNAKIQKHKNLIKRGEEQIKQIEVMKKEAKMNKNYDLLTKIDSMKIMKISEDGKVYEVNASEKNRSSIICRYASRSKRLEILSTRKQLKEKT